MADFELLNNIDILSAEEIKKNLNTKHIGKKIICVNEIDSTNNLAKERNVEPCGTVFIAELQTNGRGRRGREWKSSDKKGLCMSILLKPDISPEKVPCITLIAGLAIQKALTKLCGLCVLIKWPNDLVLNTKKAGGILCEMSCENDRLGFVVCGIGVNLNSEGFDDDIKNTATSVFIESGKKVKRNDAAATILDEFEKLYYKFLRNGIESVINEYKKACVTLGKEVAVIRNGEEQRAKAVDVTASGELVVEIDNERCCVSSGEVSVRGLFGYV